MKSQVPESGPGAPMLSVKDGKKKPQISPLRCAPVEMTNVGAVADPRGTYGGSPRIYTGVGALQRFGKSVTRSPGCTMASERQLLIRFLLCGEAHQSTSLFFTGITLLREGLRLLRFANSRRSDTNGHRQRFDPAYEVTGMKRVMCLAASLGAIVVLASVAPDIRRYLRIRAM